MLWQFSGKRRLCRTGQLLRKEYILTLFRELAPKLVGFLASILRLALKDLRA